MSDDDDWILPVGERLDDRRARLILRRFGPEAVRLGQEFAAAWRAEAPARPVEGTIVGVRTLLGPHGGFLRDLAHTGIARGMVWRRTPAGAPQFVSLVLKAGRLRSAVMLLATTATTANSSTTRRCERVPAARNAATRSASTSTR
jgi:hypothetical protein